RSSPSQAKIPKNTVFMQNFTPYPSIRSKIPALLQLSSKHLKKALPAAIGGKGLDHARGINGLP
ncbi:hypothetical protein, partial [Paenibacillus cisolokensis]|uniref:hypothetical protein n=1 Tax=Paenibacillus cisolokensis TaxID=1658519 RepID=UPI001BCC26DE